MRFLWNNAKRKARQIVAWIAGYPNTIAYPFTIRTGTGSSTAFTTSPSWSINDSSGTYTLTAAPVGNTINGLSQITCNGANEYITIPPLADSGIRTLGLSINGSTISVSAPTLKKANFSSGSVDMYQLETLNLPSLEEGNIALINTNFSSVVLFPSYIGGGSYTVDIDINDVNVDFPNLLSLYYLRVFAYNSYAGNFLKLTTIAKLDFFIAGGIANFPLLESLTDNDHQSGVEASEVYGKFTNSVSTISFSLIDHIEILMLDGSIIVQFNNGVGSPFSLFASGATIGEIEITSVNGGTLADWDTLFDHANSRISIGIGTFTAPTPTDGYANLNVEGLVTKGFTVILT
jgi:hypothetical protein